MKKIRAIARRRRNQPNLLFRLSTVAGVQWQTSWHLGRES